MAADGAEENKQPGKGFAGLESMVSDVDETVGRAEAESTARPQRAARSSGGAARQESVRRTWQPGATPAPPQSAPPPVARDPGSGGKWLKWGGAAFVVYLLWLGSSSDSPSSRRYDLPTPPKTGIAFPSPAAVTEEKPPVGTNRVLTAAQLRYCVSEKIRVEGAEKAANVYLESHVNRFNAMVRDYNSRCGEFRYRRGTLQSAERDAERIRFLLETEGRSRLSQGLEGR